MRLGGSKKPLFLVFGEREMNVIGSVGLICYGRTLLFRHATF